MKFYVAGDAFVDLFCFLDGGWPENGGDSRLVAAQLSGGADCWQRTPQKSHEKRKGKGSGKRCSDGDDGGDGGKGSKGGNGRGDGEGNNASNGGKAIKGGKGSK